MTPKSRKMHRKIQKKDGLIFRASGLSAMLLHAPGTPWKASKRAHNASEILLFPTRGGGRGCQHGSAKIKKRSKISEISDFPKFRKFWDFAGFWRTCSAGFRGRIFFGWLKYVVYTKNKHVRRVSIGFAMHFHPRRSEDRIKNHKKSWISGPPGPAGRKCH